MYECDLYAERPDPRDRALVERYVGSALSVASMTSPAQFMTSCGETARLLPHLDLPCERALEAIYSLHKRHAEQVTSALTQMIKGAAPRLLAQTVPTESFLGIVSGLSDRLGISTTATKVGSPTAVAEDTRAQPAGLVVDRATFQVRHFGKSCYLGNTLEFKLIERLARRPETYVSVQVLLDEVWRAQRGKNTVAKTISNLRRALLSNGLDRLQLDGTNRDHYALKIS